MNRKLFFNLVKFTFKSFPLYGILPELGIYGISGE
jgi:hypothetical protein